MLDRSLSDDGETCECEYEEEFVPDLELYRYLSTVPRKTIHDVHKQLEEIDKTLKGWSANIGRGMVAMSYAEEKEGSEDHRRHGTRGWSEPGRDLTVKL